MAVAGVMGLAAIVGAGTASSPVTATGDEPVTLTIGLTQDVDSANVTVGYTVSAYEVWNLQYATLTDKAAADFSTVPGLAESWEVSDDGLTVTYTLRDGLVWSDGTPLTADDIAYTVNPWLKLRASAGWSHSVLVGTTDTEDAWDAGAGADYLINEFTSVTADYNFTRSVATPDPAEDTHRVTLGITFHD